MRKCSSDGNDRRFALDAQTFAALVTPSSLLSLLLSSPAPASAPLQPISATGLRRAASVGLRKRSAVAESLDLGILVDCTVFSGGYVLSSLNCSFLCFSWNCQLLD